MYVVLGDFSVLITEGGLIWTRFHLPVFAKSLFFLNNTELFFRTCNLQNDRAFTTQNNNNWIFKNKNYLKKGVLKVPELNCVTQGERFFDKFP